MWSVGGSLRSSLLQLRLPQLPVRGVCSTVIHRKSTAPGLTWSAPASVGLTSVCCQRSLVRTASGVSGGDVAGVAGAAGASGWYSSLADSALVHLCEHFLVSVQQVSGLPWWMSIAVATLSVRTLITLPLAAHQLVIVSKVVMKTVNQLSSVSPLSHVMLLAHQRHSGKVLCACQVPKDSTSLPASDWAVAVCRHLGGSAGGSTLVAKGTGSSNDITEALRWAEEFARQNMQR